MLRVVAAASSSSSSSSNSSSTPAAALWHRDDVIWLAALSTWARTAFPGRACGGGAAISMLTGVLVAAGCSVSDAMLVLRKEGMKRSRGGLLACLQHDSKLRMLKRERGEADDQAEGGHGDGDGVEEGGGRGREKVEQAEDAAPAAGIDRIDAEEAAAAQDDDEDVLFFARMSTEV